MCFSCNGRDIRDAGGGGEKQFSFNGRDILDAGGGGEKEFSFSKGMHVAILDRERERAWMS